MTPQLQTYLDAALARGRGKATPQQFQLLEGDLDRWAAALRHLVTDIDRQLERARARLAEAEASDDPWISEKRADHEGWRTRVITLQRHAAAELADVDCRRATLAHQKLRLEVDRLHEEALEGAISFDGLDAVRDLLELLDEIDPLPAAATT